MGSPSPESTFRPNSEQKQGEKQQQGQDRKQSPVSRFDRLDRVFESRNDPTNDELVDAITTVGGIQESVFRAYLVVLDNPGSTISEVATILDTAYSNARRRLKQLREKGLVSRYRVIPSSGGQEYQYHAQSLSETSQWLRREIDEWTETVNKQVKTLKAAHTV